MWNCESVRENCSIVKIVKWIDSYKNTGRESERERERERDTARERERQRERERERERAFAIQYHE